MEKNCTYRKINLKNSGMKILIAVAALLLLVGEASAQTACPDLSKVQKWNGSISFSYSNTGSKSDGVEKTVEWNLQQSTDVSFKLDGAYVGLVNQYSSLGSVTGIANLNDTIKTTYKDGKSSTGTLQGSGSPFLFVPTLEVDLTTCKYKFTYSSDINAVGTDNNIPLGSYRTLVGVGKSGFYPITSTILGGSANFPAENMLFQGTTDYYIPGGLAPNTLEYASNKGSATVTWEFIPLDIETIKIRADPSELNVLLPKQKSKITVTAKKGNEPVKGMAIEIKVCTEPGKKDTDGHVEYGGQFEHDNRNKCEDKGNRPAPELMYKGKKVQSPFEGTTDDKGEIVFNYFPPTSVLKKYIAGKDKITATSKRNPSIKDEKSIITKLPYELQQKFFSADCKGEETYYFERQGKHGCIFHGTGETNRALLRIANAFWQKQIECSGNPGSKCGILDDSVPRKNITVAILGAPKKIKITAMSLPWGGLHDIKGDWNPSSKSSHKSHNNGKMADIGFGDFKVGNSYDKDRILLLRHIITQDPNYNSFATNEGDNLANTLKQKAPHIHINFKE